MKGETRISRIRLHLHCIKNHIQGIYREIPTMKFPKTTPTTKIAIKISTGLLFLGIVCLFANWLLPAAILGNLSGISFVLAVFLKKY